MKFLHYSFRKEFLRRQIKPKNEWIDIWYSWFTSTRLFYYVFKKSCSYRSSINNTMFRKHIYRTMHPCVSLFFLCNIVYVQAFQCARTKDEWNKASGSLQCQEPNYYHCLRDENGILTQQCLQRVWIQNGRSVHSIEFSLPTSVNSDISFLWILNIFCIIYHRYVHFIKYMHFIFFISKLVNSCITNLSWNLNKHIHVYLYLLVLFSSIKGLAIWLFLTSDNIIFLGDYDLIILFSKLPCRK